jgi:poly(hydroxyalkanoate) depolymerase family esterase
MSPDFQAMMLEATRLTRSGNLAAAQAAIQAALGGAPAPGTAASARAREPETIDVVARRVDEPASLPTKNRARPAASRGAGMKAGRHTAAGLHCDYELFVPQHAAAQPLPLVVMLHGCTQNPADFAAGTRMNELAQAQGFVVLYPAQSRRMNPQGCWNWFKHSHQQRGRGEPALLASLTREVIEAHNVDPARVYVAGLSAGGAMAAVLGQCYPELYAAVGVHSGLAPGVATDLPSALAAMKGASPTAVAGGSGKPVIVFHGDADGTVHPRNAAAVVASSTRTTAAVEDSVAADRPGQRCSTRSIHRAADGRAIAEHWTVHGGPHAWSGGSPECSYTDPSGPNASAEMWRFFREHPLESSRDGDSDAVH